MIIDNGGNRSLLENKRVLKPDGKYVQIGGGEPDNGKWIGPLASPVKMLLLSLFVSQELRLFIAELNQPDLTFLGELID